MVDICTKILERSCRPKVTHRHPSDVRRISSRLGRPLPTHGCSRMLERTCSTSVIQLSRTSSDTLQTFISTLKGKHVLFLCDNVTAVAYVNFQGGPSPELTTLAQAVWGVALENNITITAKHLAGSANGRADGLSRLPPSYEWKMHPKLWTYLDKIWGPQTGSFCFHSIGTTATLQQFIPGPALRRCRCICANKLAQRKQLCEQSIQVTAQSREHANFAASHSHCNRAMVAHSTMVSKTSTHVHSSTGETTPGHSMHEKSGSTTRTTQKQTLENLCLLV